jgi:MFS family permease
MTSATRPARGRDLSEFRRNWRALAACFIGMGSGLSINSFIVSTFAPYLLEEFAWTRAQWALLGMTVVLIIACVPIAGRLTDLFGVRRVAGVGAVFFPLSLAGFSMIGGDIRVYFALYVAQTILCCTTTATIYTRLVAEKFHEWRGLALAICASSPAVIGAIGSPLVSAFVHSHGWRTGYLAVALYTALGGAIALALTPPALPRTRAHSPAPGEAASRGGTYRAIARQPAFWIMLVATFLVSMPHALVASQLKLVVLAQGVDDLTAAMMVSLFAAGVIAGRLMSGLALDWFPPHSVAAFFLGLPAFGLLLLASPLDTVPVLGLAIVLVGLAFGGEGDVIAYLVVRYFGIAVYSTVLGVLTAAMAAASAVGAAVLSVVLKRTDKFDIYLIAAAAAVAAGSLLFQYLGKHKSNQR